MVARLSFQITTLSQDKFCFLWYTIFGKTQTFFTCLKRGSLYEKTCFVSCFGPAFFAWPLPVTALANAAEPPRLSGAGFKPPKDLQLSLVFTLEDEAEPVKAEGTRLAWGGGITCSGRPLFPDLWDGENLSGGIGHFPAGRNQRGSIFHPCGQTGPSSRAPGTYYNNLCVLDLSAQTLTPGAPWWRQPLLVFLRVGLTLLLEGAVFLPLWLPGTPQLAGCSS